MEAVVAREVDFGISFFPTGTPGNYEEYLTQWEQLKNYNFKGKSINTTRLLNGVAFEKKRGPKVLAYPLNVAEKGQLRDKEIARRHLMAQFINLINDGDLYFYIRQKELGADGKMPHDIKEMILNAKKPEDLKRPYLAMMHFVENEDRYRDVGVSTFLKEALDGIFEDKLSFEDEKDRFIYYFDDYNSKNRLEILKNTPKPGVDTTDDNVTPKNPPPVVTTTTTTTTTNTKSTTELLKEISELKQALLLSKTRVTELEEVQKVNVNAFLKKEEEIKKLQETIKSFEQERLKEVNNQSNVREASLANAANVQRLQREKNELDGKLKVLQEEIARKDDIISQLKQEKQNSFSSSEKKELDEKIKLLEERNKALLEKNTDETIAQLKEEIEQNHQDRIREERIQENRKFEADGKIQKLTEKLTTYEKMDKFVLHEYIEEDVDDKSQEKDLGKMILVERESVSRVIKRLYAFNRMTFVDSNLEIQEMNEFDTKYLKIANLFQVNDPDIRKELQKLLREENLAGTKGQFQDLHGEMFLALMADNFKNTYNGSDQLTFSFLADNNLKTRVQISNIAFQKFPLGGDVKFCSIPMDDSESYNKIYNHFSPLGKNVIASEGEFIVERKGFDTLRLKYKMDYDTLNGELYHGRGFNFEKDGILLCTKFMSREHHEIDKIVIAESEFKSEEETTLNYSSPVSETKEVEGEGEIFEVPVYPIEKSIISENLSLSSAQKEEEEGDWPSDF